MKTNCVTPTSHKELAGKLKAARDAVKNSRISFAGGMEDALYFDSVDLKYDIGTESRAILLELISKTKPENYMGGRPPQKSCKGEIIGQELFAFKVKINRFDCHI